MQTTKIYLILIIALILDSGSLFAQRDYVVTLKNDTIKCEIKRSLITGNFRYRIDTNKGFKSLPVQDYKEIFDSRDTILVILKNPPPLGHPYFVYWLERGKINLYEQIIWSGSGTTRSSSKYWYATKGKSDSLIQIKTDALMYNHIGTHKQRIQSFLNLINDCEYVATELQHSDIQKSYDFDRIREYIQMYNQKCPVEATAK
ncbi:MAG: hypothetical protein JWP45_1403 [Mucilaginibacter sp.]|nr:hypothetical protein [Mucilaginibacter sp.]